MKKIFTLLLMIMYLLASAQEHDQEVVSAVKQVTVFLQGAQVSRNAQVNVQRGNSTIVFTGISPNIQEQSIQASASSSVKILSVSFGINYMDEVQKPEKLLAIDNEQKRLISLLEKERSLQSVYKEEETILKVNKSIGGTEQGVRVEELKNAMDYFRSRLMEINQKLLDIEQNIRKYSEALLKTESQQKELRSLKGQPTGQVIVKVSSTLSTTSDFKITYLVNDAKWYPSYDIRAKDIQSPITVTYKANISQQSGEDWNKVQLSISSSNPSVSGARPVMKPWILGFNNSAGRYGTTIGTMNGLYGSRASTIVTGRVVDDAGQGMPGANVMISGTTVGTTTDVNGYYSLPLTTNAQLLVVSFIGYVTEEIPIGSSSALDVIMHPDIQQLSEVIVTGYGLEGRAAGISSSEYSYTPRVKKVLAATPVIRQTALEFTLDDPFTIKSDGEVRMSEMIEYEMDALYEYYSAPKLDASAFLTARILHWDEYSFMEGEASLYFEGKYIGKSIIETRNTNDTLTLSLGRDPSVVVKREKVKDISSKQFVGSSQKVVYAFDISIRNSKRQRVSIVIEDQVPVPNTKEIDVDKLEYTNGEYDSNTGIVKWKKEIAPSKTETFQLKYSVRFPKYSTMILE
jgi:hypothetical protein